MVDLQDQLFTDTYQLRSDFETRWRAIADQVRLFPGVVACFYLIDEPYLHYDRDATRSALATAAARVRQDFPQVPIAVILSKSEVDTINSGYISMFDWVGFDRYRAFAELPPIIQRLEAMLSPSQREIAVPWAFRRVSEGLGVPEQDEVVQNINGWHNEILANPRYIAVVPFLWETIDDMVGARELPMIGERTKQLASYTLSRTTRVPHDVMHTVLEMFKF